MSRYAPPPAYASSRTDELALPSTLVIYQAAEPATSSTQAAQHLYLYDYALRRWTYTVRIPKKREGWKADVSFVTEKEREEMRYEVRREPLARKFDFRPPDGLHNVMVPSSFSSKAFSIETVDGQKLHWRKESVKEAKLISLPSNTTVAHYQAHDASLQDHTGVPQKATYRDLTVTFMGHLSITTFPCQVASSHTNELRRSQTAESSSSSSSDRGPRLRGSQRTIAVGLCAPAVVGAAISSPQLAAGMNRHCAIGDELSNLGKTTISGHDVPIRRPDAEFGHSRYDSTHAAQAEYWANQNRTTVKNSDPRPRFVEFDLIVASLAAVLAA